ncbi:LysR family transcriptional regulator (plasmid) [Pantoea eucalypti]|uniref:LysR family transcriptional regulator n=1 Tax=Pantoea eucalypti TaxID=470933 RepID=A0ABY2ZQZ9_9GAMM|nr:MULTISPECIES: LysR substrate-binding domain-containing protein [Pantoea]AWP34951.1 LysR family transcriptional regulator [Pantoea vagans]QGF28996.1 LysR family transcriptional regulator [Pantoea eucalypti]TPV37133.1 LysR family transcriptional regulator [Pantoea eucalypti]
MRSLNRLKWLHAFEATARHGSFKGAADELGVTPAAVGQLVRALEEWVGHPLLLRSRSGKTRLTLVSEAQDALQDISHGLDELESGLNKLRGRRARSVILLTASQVLLMNWLMERLNRFSEQHQNIDIRLDVTERLSDVIHGEADLGVRCGPGDWAGLSKTWLMDEEAVIVCSPRLLGTGARPSPQWLAGEKRIQDDTPHPGAGFPSWDTIFERLKAPPAGTTTLHINSTAAAIMTALSGRGVAVVRRALVQQLIDTNQLVLLFPEHRWPLTWSYYLVMSEHSRMRPEVKILHDWLVQDVSDSQISS